jgi:hypothetical protein
MFKQKTYLFSLITLMIFLVGVSSAQAICQGKVYVTVKEYYGETIKNAKFTISEQLVNTNNDPVPGKILAANFTDKYTGIGLATVNLTDGLAKYALKVSNPTFEGTDFWYYNQLNLACGQSATTTITLGAIKFKATANIGDLQKSTKFIVYKQTTDANGLPAPYGKEVGGGDTGTMGEKKFYLPRQDQTIDMPTKFYMMEIKNAQGLKFYKYDIEPPINTLKEINYRFSDMIIRVKDEVSGALLPNIKLNLFERLPGKTGGYETGRMITTLETDDRGQIYYQYPAGNYILQYTKPSGEKVNFVDITINTERRQEFDILIKEYNQKAICDIKSKLQLGFRDFDDKIIGNLNFNIYEQKLNDNGVPIAGGKISQGRVDANGLASVDFFPQPAKKYLLEVCDKSAVFGCFWFSGIDFECKENLTLERNLKSVDVVLRNGAKGLLPGQKFRIYLKQLNVDGKIVIDKTKQVGQFTLSPRGDFRLYLDNRQLNGDDIEYLLAMDYGKKEVFVPFKVIDDAKTVLQYLIGDPLTPYGKPVMTSSKNKLVGRILLQVESKGEAWYVNPVDNKRYFLGKPEEAFAVMRRLSIGATTATLNKIRANVDIISPTDIDTDGDGLSDAVEGGLETDPNNPDTDGDGYGDYNEVKGGYNPFGAGSLKFDDKLVTKNLGKIFLQVEKKGEAWYINPLNRERYYLSRPSDAFAIMRKLGLGITNADLAKITVGPALK